MNRAGRTVLAVLTAAPLCAVAAPAAATPPAWSVSQAQYVADQNFILNAVDVPAAGDIWAVGYRYEYVGGATEFRTVVEHGQSGGGTFQLVPSPDREGAPATNFLQDVDGASPSDLWAVGWSRDPGQPSRTLVEHWDGANWKIAPSQDPGQYGNILEGVLAVSANDVWAVGARQDGFYQTPTAEHWDGTAWSVSRVPNPPYCNEHSYLTDIAQVSADDLWAVGWCESSERDEQGYVARYDGSRWRYAAGVTAGIPIGTEVYGVSAAGPHSVWLDGLVRSDGALVLHWNGTTMTQVNVGAQQSNESLAAAVTPHGRAGFAVGAGGSPQPPFAGPAVVRLNGAAAQGVQESVPVDYGSLRGVAYDPSGRIWAVGTQLPGRYNTPLIVSRPVP